jgi:hypothetical protein
MATISGALQPLARRPRLYCLLMRCRRRHGPCTIVWLTLTLTLTPRALVTVASVRLAGRVPERHPTLLILPA